MAVLLEVKKDVVSQLQKAVESNVVIKIEDLEIPPDPSLGDVAFPCFALAKELKKNPMEIAQSLAGAIEIGGVIKSATAEGAYVNILFDEAIFGEKLFSEVANKKELFGWAEEKVEGSIMVEYAAPNTHKSIHVGHLRNFLVGQVVVNTLKASGHDVHPVSYINDLGRHVALTMWGLDTFHKGEKIEEQDRIPFLARVYAKASEAAKEDEEVQKEISKIFKDLEKGQGDHVALWQETRKWSLAYFKGIFDELGLSFEKTYYESDLMDQAFEIIESLKEQKIACISEGALIVDLEEEKLGVNLLVRTDGTLLYNAKDLALAYKKEEDMQPDRSVYVIDARQSLAMKQLFATLAKMNFKQRLEHLSYEFVTTKDGAMASRTGNIILYEDFRDQMIEMARKETAGRHEDWSEEKIQETARAVAFGALRFGMLKQDLDKKIVFDMEEALSFEGFTGPYLLYTYARTQSIVKKAVDVKEVLSAKTLTSKEEHKLLLTLARFSEEIALSGKGMQISGLAHYLFELAKDFSVFYNEHSVLNAEGEVAAERLMLVKAVGQVIKNGLDLLGMDVVEEM